MSGFDKHTAEADKLREVRAALRKISHLGADETGSIGPSCHWHHEAADIAREALARLDAREVQR